MIVGFLVYFDARNRRFGRESGGMAEMYKPIRFDPSRLLAFDVGWAYDKPPKVDHSEILATVRVAASRV